MLDKEKGETRVKGRLFLYIRVGETRTLFSEWGAGGRGEVLLVGVRREEGQGTMRGRQRRGGGEAWGGGEPWGKGGTSNPSTS